MSDAPHVFVVTCPVPPDAAAQLRVEVAGREVTASSPDGFTHLFDLPKDVAIDQLGWQVYADALEVRAPYRSTSSVRRYQSAHSAREANHQERAGAENHGLAEPPPTE